MTPCTPFRLVPKNSRSAAAGEKDRGPGNEILLPVVRVCAFGADQTKS